MGQVESKNGKAVSGVNVKTDYYENTFIFKWTIENFYRVLHKIEPSKEFEPFSGVKCKIEISRSSIGHKYKFITSSVHQMQYKTSLFEDSGKQILQNSTSDSKPFGDYFQSYHYFDLTDVKLPNDRLIFICEVDLRQKIESEQKFTAWSKKFSSQNEYLKTLVRELEKQGEHELENMVEFNYNGEILSVNRKILSLRSPVFAKLLKEKDQEGKKAEFEISTKSVPAMKAMISFTYTGLVPDCNFNTLCRLYHVSLFYNVDGLQEACGHALLPQLTPENVCDALRMAICHEHDPLQDVWNALRMTAYPAGDPLEGHLLAFVKLHLETVLKTDGWRELVTAAPQLALKILKQTMTVEAKGFLSAFTNA